ncbi:MAG: diaminopimelate decarboxylase [Solirubrobacteraceae bacterium]
MARVAQAVSSVYPLGSRLNEAGRLEVGGCDVAELAREVGTPAYVVAEDDLRARARAFAEAMRAGNEDSEVLFASKAFPCTAVYRLFAEEGLSCDVASGGELHMALAAGFGPERIYLHGNAKSDRELREAVEAGVGHVVVDNLEEIGRLAALLDGRSIAREAGGQPVLVRVTPGIKPSTHDFIATGQLDSKFGLPPDDARAAIERIEATPGLELRGLHMHIGSQIFELESFRKAIEAISHLGDFPVYDLGGGLGVAYTAGDEPPSIEDYVEAKVGAVHEVLGPGKRLLIEPGRALVANSTVTVYTVESVKRSLSTYVAVDGGMSDNLRPMLYGSVYEAALVDRLTPGGELCHVAGKHCESGDVIVRDVHLHDPRPGDLLVTPATGAYGHALANNYNGVPRPPVVFCKDGDARVVVRRETYEDLTARDE